MVQATNQHPAVGPLRQVDAGLLNVGYVEAGPGDGRAVVLLHGWPHDIHSYLEVAPLLAAAGYRVVVPYFRGFGTTRFRSTRFRSDERFRNGEPDDQELEEQLAHGPVIGVPTSTLEGDANGAPHPDPSSYASKFSGASAHRTIEGGIGHNLPQEAPEAFANAVIEVDPS
jgi:pimeloyl-ACP methyl ester carboxylesterase